MCSVEVLEVSVFVKIWQFGGFRQLGTEMLQVGL